MEVDREFKETLDLLTLESKSSKESNLNQTRKLSYSKVKLTREKEQVNHHDLPFGGDNYAPYCIKQTTKKVVKSYSYNNKSTVSIDKSTVKLSVNPNTGQRQYKLTNKRKKVTSYVYTTNSEQIGYKGKDKQFKVHTVKSSRSLYRVDKRSNDHRTSEDIPIPCDYNMERRPRSSRRDTAPIADSYYPFNEDYNHCAPCCAGAAPKVKPERSTIKIRGTFDVEKNDLYLFECSAIPAKDYEGNNKIEQQKNKQSIEDGDFICYCDQNSEPTRRSQGIQVCVRQSSLKSQPIQCNCKSITELKQKYGNIKPNNLKVCESPLVIVSVYPNYAENSQRNNLKAISNESRYEAVDESSGMKSLSDSTECQPKKKRNVSSPQRKKLSPSSSPTKKSKDNLRSPTKSKTVKEDYSKSTKNIKTSIKKDYASGGPSKISPRNKKNTVDSYSKTRKIKITSIKTNSSKRDSSPRRKKQEDTENATSSARKNLRSVSPSPSPTPRRSVTTSRDSSRSKKSCSSITSPHAFTKRDPCYRSLSIFSESANKLSKDENQRQSANDTLKAFIAQRKQTLEKETEIKNAKKSTYPPTTTPQNKSAPQAKMTPYKPESPKKISPLSSMHPIQRKSFAKQYSQASNSYPMPGENRTNRSAKLSSIVSAQNKRKSNQSNEDYYKIKDENLNETKQKDIYNTNNENSNIHINIDGKNEKYDVSLHRGTVLNDVMILQQVKDQGNRKACRPGCPGPCNQKQTRNNVGMSENGNNIPKPRSSSTMECHLGLSFALAEMNENRDESVGENDTEVDHRQKRDTSSDEKSVQRRKTKRDKNNRGLTPERHHRGDDCITTEVLDRDREIRTLLGVNTIRDSNSENFKEKVAEFLNMSSMDCIYKNCYLITKSSSSCNMLQNNILMRGSGNIVLNIDSGLYQSAKMSREFNIRNIVSARMAQELPYHNISFEYKASMQLKNNKIKEAITHTSKDLMEDELCNVPSIVSCSIDIKRDEGYPAINLTDADKPITVDIDTHHDSVCQIDKDKADIMTDRCDIFNNMNDALINELAICQTSDSNLMEVNIPNEAFIRQLLFTTNKILKSRLSNLDPLTAASNHVQFIYHGKGKPFTPNVQPSAFSLKSEFESIIEDSPREAPAMKTNKPLFKRIFSYVKKLANSGQVYEVKSSIIGAIEMTSSIYDTSLSFAKHQRKKSKRSFIGSVRKVIGNWKWNYPTET